MWEKGAWPPPHILYGGDYNPEQWPREVWPQDAALMRQAGVNYVTAGVFSWAFLEPSPGEFEFGWLRDVLDLLDGAGVAVGLATPTAAPPPWLTTQHPDVLPVDARGVRYSHGSRQHFCVHSPAYREHAIRITGELARALGDHPAIRLWHVHNEYACHVPACYCDHSAAAFRGWLRERYGTPKELNEAWGTAFWSQRYASFDEVLPPRITPAFANPAHELDYHRFSSDSYLAMFRAERDLLRELTPGIPVTTNFMGFHKPLDYFSWAAEEDFCSTDSYPDPADPDSPMLAAMHYDLVRSLKPGIPWTLMEQTTLRVNWRAVNAAKSPGAMRAGSYQALARGSAGILFFQWRASRAGAEKFHSAMVPHAGTQSPVWADVAGLGSELSRLSMLNATSVDAHCAIVFSWPNWWALELPSKPSADIGMLDQLAWVYRPLFDAGITADFAHPGQDLSCYPLIVVPSLYLLTEEEGGNIRRYVQRGGTAVISFWSGIVNSAEQVYLGPYGGPLRELFGGAVLDVAPLQPAETAEVAWADGRRSNSTHWLDLIEPGDGEVLASYASTPWAGRPAVLRHQVGDGQVFYLGTRLDTGAMRGLLATAMAGHRPPGGEVAGVSGVERVVRRDDRGSYEFLINHAAGPASVPLTEAGTDLLSGDPVSSTVELTARGVAIIHRES